MLSDAGLAARVVRRADVPLTEDLYRGVWLPKIRFLKRGRFTPRVQAVLVHLSLDATCRALPERAESVKELVRQQPGVNRYMLDLLEQVGPLFGHFNPRVEGVAAWALETSQITLGFGYLVQCLEKLVAEFDAQDVDLVRNERDRERFIGMLRAADEPVGGADVLATASVIARAVQTMELLESYRSIAVLRNREDESLKVRDFVAIDWPCRFVVPDRIYVFQAGGRDFDEWITVGEQHYWNLGFWLGPITNKMEPRNRLNVFLRIHKVSTIPSSFTPVRAPPVLRSWRAARNIDLSDGLGNRTAGAS